MSRPTDFQKQVWANVRQIPPGKVTTYGDIPTALGSRALAIGEAFRQSRTNCRGGGCCTPKAALEGSHNQSEFTLLCSSDCPTK